MIKTIFICLLFLSSVNIHACITTQGSFELLKKEFNVHTIAGPNTPEEIEVNELLLAKSVSKFMENYLPKEIENLPFGYENKNWVDLKEKFTKGDSFYKVKYKDNIISSKIVLVRNNCIKGSITLYRAALHY